MLDDRSSEATLGGVVYCVDLAALDDGTWKLIEADEHAISGGLAWTPFDDLQLDVSAGAGLNAATPDFFVAFGGAWRFFLPWNGRTP